MWTPIGREKSLKLLGIEPGLLSHYVLLRMEIENMYRCHCMGVRYVRLGFASAIILLRFLSLHLASRVSH
jgi:hypothetical protein